MERHFEEEFEKKLKIVEDKAKENSSADMLDADYKKKLKEEMAELKDDLEMRDDMLNALIKKERDSTDEVPAQFFAPKATNAGVALHFPN